MNNKPVLVAGATGYVGGRLLPRLLAEGHRVRAMGRSVAKMGCRPWASHPLVALVQGDVLDIEALSRAARGCSAAFYLVHSMVAQGKAYAEADRRAALNMTLAAEKAGLKQIIYLGGLGDARHPRLSSHLASRHEVGDILRSGPVPVTILRAAMILGAGSASFEILRYLVERLPVMITPRWVKSPTQPIAIANVLDYLVGCLNHEQTRGKTFDIGGPDILNYKQLFGLYAEAAGLTRRVVLPVPVLTPRLSAGWIHLVTPVPAAIARPLTEGLSVPTTCTDNRIHDLVPVDLLNCRQAISAALENTLANKIDVCWRDAGDARPPEWVYCGDAAYAGGTIFSLAYRIHIKASPKEIWPYVDGIGGAHGYYFADYLWRLRGVIDRITGGVGLSGRRNPSLRAGDAFDFWRVAIVDPPHDLLLRSEMKAPGEAVLKFHIRPTHGPAGEKKSELSIIARFLPHGLAGLVYWYAFYPFHQWIFQGMLKRLSGRFDATRRTSCARFKISGPDTCLLPSKQDNLGQQQERQHVDE